MAPGRPEIPLQGSRREAPPGFAPLKRSENGDVSNPQSGTDQCLKFEQRGFCGASLLIMTHGPFFRGLNQSDWIPLVWPARDRRHRDPQAPARQEVRRGPNGSHHDVRNGPQPCRGRPSIPRCNRRLEYENRKIADRSPDDPTPRPDPTGCSLSLRWTPLRVCQRICGACRETSEHDSLAQSSCSDHARNSRK